MVGCVADGPGMRSWYEVRSDPDKTDDKNNLR